jgi:hypothetical protein
MVVSLVAPAGGIGNRALAFQLVFLGKKVQRFVRYALRRTGR